MNWLQSQQQHETQFFLTLPSNTIESGGQGESVNRQCQFQVKLPQRISLGLDWEVALSEIIYPHSWYNIRQEDGDEVSVSFYDHDVATGGKFKVEPGCYENPDDLAAVMNKAVERICRMGKISVPIRFAYDGITRRYMVIKLRMTGVIIEMGDKIRNILGFETKGFKKLGVVEIKSVYAKYPVDLRAGFDSMYVYCNLVRNQVIGNYLAPLLRVVPIEGHADDIICRVYNLPHYLPMDVSEFDSVEISIKDDRNHLVPFLYGKVIIKLHFRRKKSYFF